MPALYVESWNGDGRFTVDRIGRGTLDIPACCLSMLATIQPGPLQSYLFDAVNGGRDDDGLMPRFQLAVLAGRVGRLAERGSVAQHASPTAGFRGNRGIS